MMRLLHGRSSGRIRALSTGSTASSTIKLWGFPLSQPTRSVLMLLKDNKVPYEFIGCDPFKGENRKPDFLKSFPVGLVPVIEHDGLRLGESAAILAYCAELYAPKLLGTTPQQRANVNYWLHWHHANSRFGTKGILHSLLLPKMYPKLKEGADERLKAGTKSYSAAMKHMDNHLKSHKFLASGESLTIADLQILTEVDQLSADAFGFFDYAAVPNVTRWLGDCRSVVSSYQDVFQPVQDIARKMDIKPLV